MTEKLLSDPALTDLYRGPLKPFLDCFGVVLSDEGYARTSIKEKLRVVADFRGWLHQQHFELNGLSDLSIDEFMKYQRRKDPIRRGHAATLRLLLAHLGSPDIILESKEQECGAHNIEIGFAQYLSRERGLSPITIGRYIPLVRYFLNERFNAGTLQIREMRPNDVTAFLLRYLQMVKRKTAKTMGAALRAFFRYLRLRGEIESDLAEVIPSIADWRLSDIPKSLDVYEVERLLSNCDRNNKAGQRDYTILLILARLGLRAGEITKMTLDDIDWEAGELIIQGKGPRKDRIPLPWDVGEALATYLQQGRPACSTRRVFIRTRAPYRGFSSSVAVCNIVERALSRAKLHPPCKGAHLLRHSLATNMLRKGASLGEIGEILRHTSITTTEIYAKVDIVGLRTLAQSWPGGAA
jgi:site-specific recombinase XerD